MIARPRSEYSRVEESASMFASIQTLSTRKTIGVRG